MDCRKIMLDQLATDFNVIPERLSAGKNLFSVKEYDSRKRAYENGEAMLQVLCINGIAVFNAMNEDVLEALRKTYSDYDAAWFFDIGNFRRLDALLRPFGQMIASCHQYFIPGERTFSVPQPDCDTVWYRDNELSQFRGDGRFGEALGFNAQWPDRLAVAARLKGELLGMAAASSDSETMWQIGVDVVPSCRSRGIGTALTFLLKNRLLKDGILPFYGTAASHIISQNVAVAAGFVPAWTELYTKSV